VRESRLADPAEAERSQGDAQLTGRKVGIELSVNGAQDVPAPAVSAGDSFHLCGAQLDHGELGGNEEAVEQHEEQGKENQTEIGEIGRGGVTGGGVHEGVG